MSIVDSDKNYAGLLVETGFRHQFQKFLRDAMDGGSAQFARSLSSAYDELSPADRDFAFVVFSRAFRLLRLSLQ